MQQTGVTDVIIAALFAGCVWELSALVTERSHRKMGEALWNASLCDCYPANLCVGLVEVRASDRVSQKKTKPQKSCLSACLVEAEESAAHIVVERESQVRFVGAVSAEAKFSSCSLSRSAGADEVTEALAGCCCSVSGGLSAHCKLRAHMPLTEHCVLSQYCIQRFYPPCIWQWSHLLPYVLLMSFNNRFSYSSESASSVM